MPDLFIGREEYLNRLRKDFFFVEPDSYGHCYSLIGLNGIGKTALIRHLSEEFEKKRPPKAFYFATEIIDGITTFWSYWAKMLEDFSDEIREDYINSIIPEPDSSQENSITKIKEAYQFIRDDMLDRESELFKRKLLKHLEIFKHYTRLGIRILITIDEFDRAETTFKGGQFFQYLFGLAPKGAAKVLNLSIITISRRSASTIVHDMNKGSNFEDAYPRLILNGFNDSELEEYFNTYVQLPCGLLSEEKQKQILYLCGRSPGLLMGLRHELKFISETDINIGQIYAKHGQFIKGSYDRMISLMEEAYSDRARKKPLLDLYVQKFIGPAHDDDFKENVSLLYDYGFVTMVDENSRILYQSGLLPTVDDGQKESTIQYEPITPYFVEYIKYRALKEMLSDLSGMLIRAEQLAREIIEKEMRKAFPDTWDDIINSYAGQKDYYLETLQMQALKNDFFESISKLNVISFKEYYYIISDHWNLFSKYFTAYPNKAALFSAMTELCESRNCSSHLNLRIYNGENQRKLRETCRLFISSLETEPGEMKSDDIPTNEQIEVLVSSAARITFVCQTIKMPKRNLRGIIKESGFPAGVAQRNIEAFGFDDYPKVGDEFSAVVDRWDSNAQMFNLRAPD